MSNYQPIPGVTVIGFGHKARQGKDTVAGFIQDILGSKAERLPFAEDLYAVCRVMFGMTTKDPRLLQVVGTEVFRNKDPQIWVNSVYQKLQDRRPRVALITDVRFPNEVEFVKQLGGTAVKVARTNDDGTPYRDPNRPENHPSESSLDGFQGWDYVFTANTGNMGYLKFAAGQLIADLGL